MILSVGLSSLDHWSLLPKINFTPIPFPDLRAETVPANTVVKRILRKAEGRKNKRMEVHVLLTGKFLRLLFVKQKKKKKTKKSEFPNDG